MEIIAGAGYDWILLDMEHAPNDLGTMLGQLQAIAGYRVHPIVRLAENNMIAVMHVLDMGVQSILVPHVTNVEDARRAVAYTRYPPAGVRGVGGTTRANRFGRVKDYIAKAHEEVCVIAMVECAEGLSNLEAICATEGIDGVLIGPGDLSAAMGHPGNSSHPEVLRIIEDAIRCIAKAGGASGYMSAVEADAQRMVAAGVTFCGVGMDAGLLARSAEALRARFGDDGSNN